MKTYQITIHIEEVKETSLMSSIFAEVEQEKREKEIARKVNMAANEVRLQFFKDLLKSLNKELKLIGKEITKYETKESNWSDGSLEFYIKPIYINRKPFLIYLIPATDRTGTVDYGTRYATSTEYFSINVNGTRISENGGYVGNILNYMKEHIKEELHKN
jgi:hypothetical protein